MGTAFAEIYNSFLNKITDDMYLELTPEDTIRDLQRLIIDAIPNFEFPRKNLYDYVIKTEVIDESEATDHDFIIGVVWGEISEDNGSQPPKVTIEKSYFTEKLTPEEINIISLIMLNGWLQRQITSIENTRMKYSGTDFKMTSQANHLSKLLSLQTEVQRQSFHMQRLYKRRKTDNSGKYVSNWASLIEKRVIE